MTPPTTTTPTACAPNSIGEFLRFAPKASLRRFLDGLNEQQTRFLLGCWSVWARGDQLPPPGRWITWLILGGRGAGKTRAGAEWIRSLVCKPPPAGAWRIALVGETYLQAREVMVEGPSGLLAISPGDERPRFQASRRRLLWPRGAVGHLFSSEDPDALRGPQFHFAWCDELAKWRHPGDTWDMLQFALRLGRHPRQIVTTTPRPIALIKKLMTDALCHVTRATTYDNKANLSPAFIGSIIRRYEGTRLGRQELDAEILTDTPGALWSRAMIEEARASKTPQLTRIVVAVDPPAGAGKKSECGIIVAGADENRHGWILDDRSVAAAGPAEWAKRVIAAFTDHGADRIVAEVNQGGEMVAAVLRQIAPDAPLRLVRARTGKHTRAEPVAALYEQRRIHHVGAFPMLEDQLCAFNGLTAAGRSPDRLDALVWAISDLILRPVSPPRVRSL